MKGFLKRDLYLMLPNVRFYLFFLVILGGFFAFKGISGDSFSSGISFFGFYVAIFAASSILGLFSYDEMNHWQSYAAAAPGGRRGQVDGRYAVALLVGVGTTVLLMLFFLLARAFEDVPTALLYGGLFLVYLDVALPVGYRFGASSRMVMIILIGVMAGVAGGGGAMLALSSGAAWAGIPPFVGIFLTAVGLVGMVVSRGISLRIMEKKEL